MAGIDGVSLSGGQFQFMDRAEAGKCQRTTATAPQHDQALTTKKGPGTRPLCVGLDPFTGSQVGARLHQIRLIA
jgi:hypothetical protein